MKRKAKRSQSSQTWECQTCNLQMVGGPRCYAHNPTPEQREVNPQAYRREEYAPSYKRP